ncbi:MAG: alpha-amylase/4-alpha-glucanotransferase domain-containing protein [Sediminispirochaetaceae bacterium]
MRKLKIVLGMYNSPPVGTAQEQFEKAYQYSYKPFLTVLYKYAMLKGTFHFSGTLLEWLEDFHPELLMVLNEMVKRKQIEMLGGGYYSPIFPIIPSKDRLGQIELLTTYLRRKFGKRPRGCWITEGIWEPNLISTLKSSGMEYLFMDDKLFLQSGMNKDLVYQPYVTDDQGKMAIVLPLHNDYIERMFCDPPDKVIEDVVQLHADNPDMNVINILINGDFFVVNRRHYSSFFAENGWFEQFLTGLTKKAEQIETVLPGRYVRAQGPLKRVYLPSQYIHSNGIPNKVEENYNRNGMFKISTFISNRNGQSYFRQYISKYPEIHRLYSKMMYVHQVVGQVRGDRSRKKTAKEESWRGQTCAAFWHGPDGGIYRNGIRKAVYRSLINAERTTREKGIFSTSLNVVDIDLDGIPEYIYQGQFINAYVHRKGACLFELDYVVTAWNYLDTMARHRESYHDEEDAKNGFDRYSKNAFQDHFFNEDVSIDDFASGNFNERVRYVDSLYRARKVEKERREAQFGSRHEFQDNGRTISTDLLKEYDFSKNSIAVKYRMNTDSQDVIKGRFATELNLSFPEDGRSQLDVLVKHTEGETELENGRIELHDVHELSFHDRLNKTLITLTADQPATLWIFPIYTITERFGKKVWMYQQTACILSWKCEPSRNRPFACTVGMRIEKR